MWKGLEFVCETEEQLRQLFERSEFLMQSVVSLQNLALEHGQIGIQLAQRVILGNCKTFSFFIYQKAAEAALVK